MLYITPMVVLARIRHFPRPGEPWYEKYLIELAIFGIVAVFLFLVSVIFGLIGRHSHKARSKVNFPLHWAAEYGSKEEMESMLSKGADVNYKIKNGVTPLHIAARKGNVEAAKLLLAKGADVNAKDKNICTPLYLALTYGDCNQVVEILRKHGGVK